MYLEVLNLCIEQCPKGRVLSWKVREGDAIFDGTPIAEYQVVEGKQKRCILCAPYSGYVKQFLVEEGDYFNKESPVLQFVICHHDITMKGMCTTCGQNLIESPQYISHGHPHLSVSKREAERIDMENAERLLKQQKLSLVLDLDHTLLHAANFSDLKDKKSSLKEKMRKSMKTIEKFTLPPSPTRYYLKLRPGLMRFLKTLAKLYELNIYTMGTRQYATKVAQIIDKKNKFFREHRIISRDDAQDMNFKNLSRLFPCDDSMVVIVDDREDVWSSNGQVSPNLIKIEPFHYFDTIHEIKALPRDSNSRMDVVDDIESDDESNSDSDEDEEEEEEMDIHLDNVLRILIQIHQEFYQSGDNNSRDVKALIDRMKKQVLQGCVLIFSGLIPLKLEPEKSELWRLAESFGARCVKEFEGSVTHVLAAKPGTGKVHRAMKSPNTFLVNVNWLYESCKNWQQANEYDFPIGKLPVFSEPTFSPIPKKRKLDTSSYLFDSKEEESNLGDEIDTFDDDEVVSMIEEQLLNELE